MKSLDPRTLTLNEISNLLCDERARVHKLLLQRGPSTTRALALSTGIDILSVRPRITELLQLGMVEKVDVIHGAGRSHEGVYRALPWQERVERMHAAAGETQLRLRIEA